GRREARPHLHHLAACPGAARQAQEGHRRGVDAGRRQILPGGQGRVHISGASLPGFGATIPRSRIARRNASDARAFRLERRASAGLSSIPTKSSTNAPDEETGLIEATPNPRSIVWGGTLQYSMPYLKSSVRDFGLPGFINHLIPLVELNLSSEVSNFDGEERTTGTVNPGVIYVADKFQLAAEAIIPINRASGDDTGVVGQLHFYLDDIFPGSLGKPLFGGNSTEHYHE